MKVQVDVTRLSTTRRLGTADQLTIRQLSPTPDPNGNWEVEIAGPRPKVVGWLWRNGYSEGEYVVIEP